MSVGLMVALTGWGRVVHTPKTAIADNYATGTTPALDEHGGQWSFHQRFWWNDPNQADLTTPQTEATTGRTDELVGYSSSRGGITEPVVLVNRTDHDVVAPNMNAGRTDCPIHAGEVFMHPYHFSDVQPYRGVLRYTVTRNGRYSLSLLARALNALWWETSHRSDVTILVNNSIIYQNQIYRPGVMQFEAGPQLDYPQLDPISFSGMYLVEGDTIDFVIGCGLTEGGEWGYQGDGVGLTIEIVEEDETEEPVEKTWDLGPSFYAAGTAEPPSNPFTDLSGSGTWGIYLIKEIDQFIKNGTAPIALACWERVTEGAVGPRVKAEPTVGEPNFLVYDPAETAEQTVAIDLRTSTVRVKPYAFCGRVGWSDHRSSRSTAMVRHRRTG